MNIVELDVTSSEVGRSEVGQRWRRCRTLYAFRLSPELQSGTLLRLEGTKVKGVDLFRILFYFDPPHELAAGHLHDNWNKGGHFSALLFSCGVEKATQGVNQPPTSIGCI